MNDWLPSLNALRAFEAVCRHLNYVHAAEELRVTPAAVKQLVHKLEETVGAALVMRRGRGLAITAAGRAGFDILAGAFPQIHRAVDRMRMHARNRRLIVSAEPSFATAWLVPRLERFRFADPSIDVLIDSSPKIVDLERGEADMAIRFGAKHDHGLVAYRLFDEQIRAFCSPSLAECLHELDDLKKATLIHWETANLPWATATRKWMGWDSWLAGVRASHPDPRSGLHFSDYNLAVQAAVAGQGVVLGSTPILQDLTRVGLLVSPFPERVDTDIGYDLVVTRQALELRHVQQLRSWMIEEAHAVSPTG